MVRAIGEKLQCSRHHDPHSPTSKKALREVMSEGGQSQIRADGGEGVVGRSDETRAWTDKREPDGRLG